MCVGFSQWNELKRCTCDYQCSVLSPTEAENIETMCRPKYYCLKKVWSLSSAWPWYPDHKNFTRVFNHWRKEFLHITFASIDFFGFDALNQWLSAKVLPWTDCHQQCEFRKVTMQRGFYSSDRPTAKKVTSKYDKSVLNGNSTTSADLPTRTAKHMLTNSSGHRLIWWGVCDIDLQWTQCFTGPYCVYRSLSHTYIYEETGLSLV